MSHEDCKENHRLTPIHLMVNGKYVKTRTSKDSKVELTLEDEQQSSDYVQRYTCISQDKKYVAFSFTHNSEPHSLTLEGEDLKLVADQSVERLGWFEMEDIGGSETHYMKTTAGIIGVNDKELLCIGGNIPAAFRQELSS